MLHPRSDNYARYTLEVLPFALRAKGFNVFGLALSGSLVFNQYINPIALKALAWKYYVRTHLPMLSTDKIEHHLDRLLRLDCL